MCQYDSEHVDSPKGDHVHALKLCYVIIVVLRTHTHNQSQSSDSNKKGGFAGDISTCPGFKSNLFLKVSRTLRKAYLRLYRDVSFDRSGGLSESS